MASTEPETETETATAVATDDDTKAPESTEAEAQRAEVRKTNSSRIKSERLRPVTTNPSAMMYKPKPRPVSDNP
jgi:hypothetical protein